MLSTYVQHQQQLRVQEESNQAAVVSAGLPAGASGPEMLLRQQQQTPCPALLQHQQQRSRSWRLSITQT
jgi:hypothetical protein